MEKTSNDLLSQLSTLLHTNAVSEVDIALWLSVAQQVRETTTNNLFNTISQSPKLIPEFTKIIRTGFSQADLSAPNFDAMTTMLQKELTPDT